MPRRKRELAVRFFATTLVALCLAIAPRYGNDARAQTPVSMELVLAVDTSMSVDGFEYGLLMKGIAAAFRNPEIIALIGDQDGVAVSLFQWSSTIDRRYMIPWRLLSDPASVAAFAAEVERVERNPVRGFTAIGGAMDFAMRLIGENGYAGRQLKIDISGDGHNNKGPDTGPARARAKALGIVINGLPIKTNTDNSIRDIFTYYRDEVIEGPGAFIEIANDYGDFARAFKRKLRRELNPLVSHPSLGHPAALEQQAFGVH